MATESEAQETPREQRLDAAAQANIERYLDNHAREGAHAWQMNMAARREQWTPIGDPDTAREEALRTEDAAGEQNTPTADDEPQPE